MRHKRINKQLYIQIVKGLYLVRYIINVPGDDCSLCKYHSDPGDVNLVCSTCSGAEVFGKGRTLFIKEEN